MRTKRSLSLVAGGLLFLLGLVLSGRVLADEPNRAGLVVQFSDERVETWCIAFEGQQLTGEEMLARSGLETILDVSGGMGITVCQIEGQGCVFPTEHCFCQCMDGGPCAYWNYFYRDSGASGWTYSPLGAALHKARNGSVEAWVWGDGHTPPAADLTFESICAVPTATAPAATATPAPVPASPTPITPEPTLAAAATPTVPPTATSQPPAPSPTPTPPAAAAPNLASYWPFGLMVLGLILVGVVVWLRR